MNSDESLFQEHIQECSDWGGIVKEFARLPLPSLKRGDSGEIYKEEWIYRGHQSQKYRLTPSIERTGRNRDWAESEYRMLREFQSKARMHVDSTLIPETKNKLGWLAMIQHYGAPTRLLDFTYSPYVGLYFALRNRETNNSDFVEVWGIDASMVRRQADKKSREADRKVQERSGYYSPERGGKVSFRSEDFISSQEIARKEEEHWDVLISNALDPCGTRREYFNRHGFVGVALPPVQNPRLSSQQGVFLLNGAEDLTFEVSLDLMMQGIAQQWYKRFRIPTAALEEAEQQLFQFNIHELSLFPDIEGLAGFVRQRLRIHL